MTERQKPIEERFTIALSELIGMSSLRSFIDDRARGAQPRRRTSEHGPRDGLTRLSRQPGFLVSGAL